MILFSFAKFYALLIDVFNFHNCVNTISGFKFTTEKKRTLDQESILQ